MLHNRPVRLQGRLISYCWPVRCLVIIVNHRPVLWRWPVRLARPVYHLVVYGGVMVIDDRFIYYSSFIYYRAVNINGIPVYYCARPAVISHMVGINICMRVALYISSAGAAYYSYMRIVVMYVINNSGSIYYGYVAAAVNVIVINLRAGNITVGHKCPPVGGYIITERYANTYTYTWP